MKMTSKQMMWCVAAAMTTGGVVEGEALKQAHKKGDVCGVVDIPVQFSKGAALTREGALKTSSGYEVQIDQVSMNPCTVGVCMESEQENLHQEVSLESGAVQTMRLSGVELKGRVFDRSNKKCRLPCEGVVIEGSLPVDVLVKKTRRAIPNKPWKSEEIVTVDYEIPAEVFDSIDWSKLG